MKRTNWKDSAELIGLLAIILGLVLVAYEIRQNTQMMRAQVFNDRSNQGIEVFLAIAENPALGEIDAKLLDGGFPKDPTAYSRLSPTQQRQYAWFMRADRFRLENILYQQQIGVIEYDEGHIMGAKNLIERYEALGDNHVLSGWGDPTVRLRYLVNILEDRHKQVNQ